MGPTEVMMAAKRAKKQVKGRAVDFGDEEEVLEEVARALGEDPDELENRRGERAHRVRYGHRLLRHGPRWPQQEWQVVEDEDQEHKLAIAVVTQDLEEEPEIFNKDFIESHIDKDKLRDELHPDALNMRVENLTEMRTGVLEGVGQRGARYAGARGRGRPDGRRGQELAEKQSHSGAPRPDGVPGRDLRRRGGGQGHRDRRHRRRGGRGGRGRHRRPRALPRALRRRLAHDPRWARLLEVELMTRESILLNERGSVRINAFLDGEPLLW